MLKRRLMDVQLLQEVGLTWRAAELRTPCQWRCDGFMCRFLNWWGKWWKAGVPSLMVWSQSSCVRAVIEHDYTMVCKMQQSRRVDVMLSLCLYLCLSTSLSLSHTHTPLIPESCCFSHHPNCQVDVTIKFIKLGIFWSLDWAISCEQGHGCSEGGWSETPMPGSLGNLSLND